MKRLLSPALLLLTLTARAQAPTPTSVAPSVITITHAWGHQMVRQPLIPYEPALAVRIGMKGVAWVRCSAAPDGTVGSTTFEHFDSLVVQSTDTADVARFGARAQTELIESSLHRVRQMTFVPAPAPQTYLVRIPYALHDTFLNTPRPPVRRPQHERPRRAK